MPRKAARLAAMVIAGGNPEHARGFQRPAQYGVFHNRCHYFEVQIPSVFFLFPLLISDSHPPPCYS